MSILSTEDFEQIKDNNTDNLDATTKCFLIKISTSCKDMGHNEQAAKAARWHCFAMLDYFGLNSLFLSITPDDKCSFRVRLYCKPQYWVRSIYSKMEKLPFFHVFTKWNALSFCNLFTCVLFIDFGWDHYILKWNTLSFCHVFTNWNTLSFCNLFICVSFIDIWSIFSKVEYFDLYHKFIPLF